MKKEQINIIVKAIDLKDILSFINVNKIEYFKYRIACIKCEENNLEKGVNNE